MSDRGSHGLFRPQSGRSIRRRKSLLYRITDTITSFLPSLFESKEEAPLEDNVSEARHAGSSAKRPRTSATSEVSILPGSSRLPCQLSISRLEGVQIPTVPLSVPIDVDVDLDAADDRSEYSIGSRASVSTSGVSSLLPRSHRNEHTTVKPSPKVCTSEYVRQGNSSNRNKGFVELWTDLEGSSQSTLNMTHSAPKRMRTESTQSSSSNVFSSPFYRGKVAYGGASSVRCTPQSRSVFEHVAPLRFIMENNEGETSKSPPSSSKAILSATAQRILHSLERHGSTMSSGNKIASPAPIPFSPLSTRSTTRYPSYMATYNRYKEFKRRFAVQSSTPSVLPQFSIACNRIEEHGDEDVTRREDTTAVTRPSAFEVSSESSQALKSTSIQPHGALAISEKPQPVVICHSGFTVANSAKTLETADKVGSHVPSTAHDACTSAKLPVEKEFLSLNQQTKFVFSNPIALGPPTRPPVTLPDASGFTFSHPKSQFKRPAPVENSSFLPILMSSRQPMVSDHPCPYKKASVPLDLDLWRCESCLMENSGRDSVCKSCHLPASVPSFSKSNSSNATSDKPDFLVNLPSNGWECPTCMVQNKMGVSECVCCHTLNPSGEVTADASKEKVATAPVFNFGPPKLVSSAESFCAVSAGDKAPISSSAVNFGISVTSSSPSPPKVAKPITQSSLISSKGWSCPTCLVKNDDSLKDCPCCKTAKPKSSDPAASRAVDCGSIPGFSFTKPAASNATPTTVTFCFGNNSDQTVTTNFKFGDSAVQQNEIGVKLAKTDKNKWECPTCMVKNGDISSCPCCQTKKPTFSLKLTPGIPNESGDKWACPTCLVRNDVLVDLCPCCQTKKPLKSSSVSVGGEWTCASCLAKNGAFASKCVSCQVKKPDIDPPIVSSPETSVGSESRSPQYASSPPVVMSTPRPFLNFGSLNPNTSSGSSFPATVVTTPSFSFSKPADASNTSAKGLELPVTSLSSNLKNGVFNFGTPATTSGFDFSAKKENVTPVVSATTSNFSSVSFNFGSSIVPAPAFKFGQPKLSSGGSSYDAGNTSGSMFFMAKDRIEWTSDSAGSAKAEQGIADVCSVAIGTYINVSCGAFL
ncbi:E3 SUMO-protein ligase RanBP2 [Taenia solium]|eukprot:TsM_000484700 transcript=TsM_000484700 gene=TsM_000484700